MKQLSFLKTFIFLVFPIFVFSTFSKSPADPAIIEEGFFIPDTKFINFRLGYDYYNAEDLMLRFTSLQRDQGFYSRKTPAEGNLGFFALNIKQRLDLYTAIGSFKIMPEFRISNMLYKAKSKTDVLYKAGANLLIFEILDFSIGADVNYSFFHSSLEYITLNDVPVSKMSNIRYKEWQIDIGLGQKITILRPYLGVSYRDARLKLKNIDIIDDTLKMKFEKKIGIFLGSSASLGSFVLINASIRLVNERSYLLSLEMRF
jgi:hypothetical protein